MLKSDTGKNRDVAFTAYLAADSLVRPTARASAFSADSADSAAKSAYLAAITTKVLVFLPAQAAVYSVAYSVFSSVPHIKEILWQKQKLIEILGN